MLRHAEAVTAYTKARQLDDEGTGGYAASAEAEGLLAVALRRPPTQDSPRQRASWIHASIASHATEAGSSP